MSRAAPVLLSVLGLALAAPVRAADLDLRVESDGIGPVAVTLHDVKPGKLPSVDLPGPDGRSLRLDLLLAESTMEGAPAYDLTLQITRRTPVGRRKVHEEVSRPTLRFKPDQAARVAAGARAPIAGTEPLVFQELNHYRIDVLIRTAPPAL